MTEHVFNNKAYGFLKDGLTAVATSMQLLPGGLVNFLPGWSSSKHMYLTITDKTAAVEIVKVTAINMTTGVITIERAQDGSSARAWYAGAIVVQRVIAGNLEQFIQKEAFRQVAYDPNGVLSADFVGEKVLTDYNWWYKNISGTNWQLIAGDTPTSLDNVTEYELNNENTTASFYNVLWEPTNGVFVAVGNIETVEDSAIFTSDDGVNWVQTHFGLGNGTLKGIAYSSSLGIFVASGTESTVSSPDGIVWTERITDGHNVVVWNETLGLFLIQGSAFSGGYSSADGINWNNIANVSANDMCNSGEGLNRIIRVYPNLQEYTLDGTNWIEIPSGDQTGSWTSIIWSDIHSKYFMCQSQSEGAGVSCILSSSDLSTWANAYTGSDRILDIIETGSLLVAIINKASPNAGVNDVLLSVDGSTWQLLSTGVADTTSVPTWNAVAYSSSLDLYVVVGSTTTALNYTNLITFTLDL